MLASGFESCSSRQPPPCGIRTRSGRISRSYTLFTQDRVIIRKHLSVPSGQSSIFAYPCCHDMATRSLHELSTSPNAGSNLLPYPRPPYLPSHDLGRCFSALSSSRFHNFLGFSLLALLFYSIPLSYYCVTAAPQNKRQSHPSFFFFAAMPLCSS